MSKPLISVIVPAHNNAGTIGMALESLLEQTYSNIEIIVVDDHSTDTTREEVRKIQARDARVTYLPLIEEDPYRFDARLQRNINAGYLARNHGFLYANGEYITFQDADDASLRNRIEVQYELLTKYRAIHLTISWLPLIPDLLHKSVDADRYLADHAESVLDTEEIYTLSQKTKGIVAKVSSRLNALIPFHLKRARILHRIFFGSLEAYPGSGNCPLFHRSVLEKVQFRPLQSRIWPSFMGRGADRDFNFQVAETFRNSYVVLVPAYLWDNRSVSSPSKDLLPYIL